MMKHGVNYVMEKGKIVIIVGAIIKSHLQIF